MRRLRRGGRPHDWAWHEEQIADNERNGVVGVESATGPIALPRSRWLLWRIQTMQQIDGQPPEFRRLVHEVNLTEAKERWRLRAVAETQADRCKHGRWRRTCPHCQWEAHKRAK